LKKLFFVIITLVIILFLFALGSFLYLKFMPAKNMNKEKAVHVLTAKKLFNEFDANETQANQKYMDRVIEVSGNIAEISNGSCTKRLCYYRVTLS